MDQRPDPFVRTSPVLDLAGADDQPPMPKQGLCGWCTSSRILDARQGRHALRLAWLLVGPGILEMLGENDGPSMWRDWEDGPAQAGDRGPGVPGR